MKIITVNLPLSYIRAIKTLTGEGGLYPSRSELIRVAVREFLIQELEAAKSFVGLQEQSPFKEKYPDPIKESPKEPEEEFVVDIDEILGLYPEKEEKMSSDIEYKTNFEMNFQKVPTMIPPISERSGRVVDMGDNRLNIDGKVFNVK